MKCAIFEELSASCVVYFRFSGTLFPVSLNDGEYEGLIFFRNRPFPVSIQSRFDQSKNLILLLKNVP